MHSSFAQFLNLLYSGGIASVSGAVGIATSTFGLLWGIGGALGIEGSPRTFGALVVASLSMVVLFFLAASLGRLT